MERNSRYGLCRILKQEHGFFNAIFPVAADFSHGPTTGWDRFFGEGLALALDLCCNMRQEKGHASRKKERIVCSAFRF